MNGEIVGQKRFRSNVSRLRAGHVLNAPVGRQHLVFSGSDVRAAFGDFEAAPVSRSPGRDDAGLCEHFGEGFFDVAYRIAVLVVREVVRSSVENELFPVVRSDGSSRRHSFADFDEGAFRPGHGEHDGGEHGFGDRLVIPVDVRLPGFHVFHDGRELEGLPVFRRRVGVVLSGKGIFRVFGKIVDGHLGIEKPLVRRDVRRRRVDDRERFSRSRVRSGFLLF